MRVSEVRKAGNPGRDILGLILGVLLALGIELSFLLLGSVVMSAGILRSDAMPQVTAAACLIGCLIGGGFTGARWGRRRLPAGLLTGLLCFGLILLVAFMTDEPVELGTQALIEFAGCLVGGGLAGVLIGKKGKRRRK